MASDPRTSGGSNKKRGETGPNTGGNLGTAFTYARKQAYCKALIEARGNRHVAARKIGVHRATVTRHYQEDPQFKEDLDGAMEEYRNILVQEAHRRGVEGVKKPLYFQGRRVFDVDEDGDPIPAFVREYDTTLLMALMKRWIPEFRDKQVVENRNLNVDMGVADLEQLSPEQREKIEELLALEEEPEGGEPE